MSQHPAPTVAGAMRPVRTIALLNQKGGVGKTTTTVNLAAALALAGRPTLLVDLDPQAHATLHLGADTGSAEGDAPAATAYDVLLDPSTPPESVLREIRPNLWVLPAETDLAAAETELSAEPDRNLRLRRFLDALGDRFEFVLMDCPPSLGLLTLNALGAAREVFIPMQAHFLALQGVSKLLETVSLVSKSVNPRLRVTGIVLCMHDTSTTHSREVVNDLAQFFEQARTSGQDVPYRTARILQPPIRRNIKLAECPSFGQTIFDYAPACPGAADYRSLAERIIADWDALLQRRSAGDPSALGNTPPHPQVVVREAPRTAPAGNSA
ncbi:MAG: AAA family ATPase [Phycisphaeraceae bacterium]|nr:AAA family ATPase [Phycisphaeraceae bacterium]